MWLAIVTAIAAGYARFIALEESRDNAVKWISEQTHEIEALKDRVSALERDRVMLERVHQIELRISTIEVTIKERRR